MMKREGMNIEGLNSTRLNTSLLNYTLLNASIETRATGSIAPPAEDTYVLNSAVLVKNGWALLTEDGTPVVFN